MVWAGVMRRESMSGGQSITYRAYGMKESVYHTPARNCMQTKMMHRRTFFHTMAETMVRAIADSITRVANILVSCNVPSSYKMMTGRLEAGC